MRIPWLDSQMELAVLFVFLCLNYLSGAELIVNVRNKGGDVDRERIEANTTADTVILEYRPKDGTYITQFIDFKSVCLFIRLICFVLR